MTETVLALIPTYGLWIILAAVWLSCFGLPIPSGPMVMTAGGFAAAGDLVLWQVIAVAFAAVVAGDQKAYWLARRLGPALVDRGKRINHMAKPLTRAENLLEARGPLAVVLSRTVITPLGPYVSYLAGALGLRWPVFTIAALIGCAGWAAGYAGLGYFFADRISDLSDLAVWIALAVAAIVAAGLIGTWLRQRYKSHLSQLDQGQDTL